MVIAMDVHKDFHHIVEAEENGTITKEYDIKNTMYDIDKFAREREKNTKIIIEASTIGKAVYKQLRKFDLELHMANPNNIVPIANSTDKTDAKDCRILIQLFRLGYLPECYVPDEETDNLRTLIRHRVDLGHKVTEVKNQVHALLKLNGIANQYTDLFGVYGMKFLKSQKLSSPYKEILDSYIRQLGHLKTEIELAEEKLRAIAKKNKRAKLLLSITGINYYSALTILAEIGDINRFPTEKKLYSYAGLVPLRRQSGNTKIQGHITKKGSSILRWILVADAHANINHHQGKLYRFYLRVSKRRGKKIAIVAVARKLLGIIYHMLKNGTEYEEHNEDLTYQKRKALMRKKQKVALSKLKTAEMLQFKKKGKKFLKELVRSSASPED